MSSNEVSDAASMFFDPEFVPHDYLDALIQSSMKDSPGDFSRLQPLQTKCSDLLIHLDYYGNELTRNLENKIAVLEDSTSVISLSEDHEETRMHYHMETLSSSVNSLMHDLRAVNTKLTELNLNSDEQSTIDNLKRLMKVKESIISVLEVIEFAKSMAFTSIASSLPLSGSSTQAKTSSGYTGTESPISIEDFNASLGILQETILEEIISIRSTKMAPEAVKLMDKMDKMIELQVVLRNLGEFTREFSQFCKFLQEEKAKLQNYLTQNGVAF